MSSAPDKIKIQFLGKGALMKELQRTLSFKAYDTVLSSSDSKTSKQLQDLAHVLYFGDANNPDSIGFAEQLLNGTGPFAGLFDTKVDVARGDVKRILKPIFHCLSDEIIVSPDPKDKGINMAVLSSKRLNNRVQLSPRSIWDFGKVVERNGKKALAIVLSSEYADTAKTGVYPSGKCYSDYLLFLCQQMFKDLGGANVSIDDDDEEDGTNGSIVNGDDSPVMRDSWTFHGYIAFALWGPIMPDDVDSIHKAVAFGASQTKTTNRKQSRKSLREQKSSSELSTLASKKEQASKPSDYLMAASIAQSVYESANLTSIKEHKFDLKCYKRKVKRAERQVERYKSLLLSDPANEEYKMKFEDSNAKFYAAEEELDDFVKSVQGKRNKPNPFEGMIRNSLSLFTLEDDNDLVTPKQNKRLRSETPMSSIDIIMDKTDNDEYSPPVEINILK